MGCPLVKVRMGLRLGGTDVRELVIREVTRKMKCSSTCSNKSIMKSKNHCQNITRWRN